ncbi:MAG: glutamate 5-kinase [Muribaculaceae bacterium]|nr:glutamate 5-kinase [Muribaculaceae bacterium]
MSKIVVKIGSNVLTRPDGKPNITNMSALVDQVAHLYAKGHKIVLVSSGAVACGKSDVFVKKDLNPVESRQLYSAVGQIRLINLYAQFFNAYGIVAGQILTQKENFSSREAYLNQRGCMMTMLENGVIPIVNENDTVSLTELMFTDNDELSGLIAAMIDADVLIILSNIDGIFSGHPDDPGASLIPSISPEADLSQFIKVTKSKHGRGGMLTKYNIASKLAAEGVKVIIAKGDRRNVLVDLIEHPEDVPHTAFIPAVEGLSTVKRWIAHSGSFSKGRIFINKKASEVLLSDNIVSLLPIGAIGIEGEWEEGDIVSIYDEEKDKCIAIGKANLSSLEAGESLGKHGKKPLVHYDYLYIV